MSDQLPAAPLDDFLARARQRPKPAQRVEGAFLRFNGKAGVWEFGTEGTTVTGKKVVINSRSFQQGFVRWGTKPPAKVWASIADAPPEPPAPFDGVDPDSGQPKTYTAEPARQVMGRFAGGQKEMFIFNTNSMGGVENMESFIDVVLDRAAEDPEHFYPLVKLDSESYSRSTGKVYKPVFTIVGWCDVDGVQKGKKKKQLKAPPEAAPEPEPAAATTGRRRKIV